MGVLFLTSATLAIFFKKFRIFIIFCFLFFAIGFLRSDFAKIKIANNDLSKFDNSQVILRGTISKEPEISQTNQKITLQPKIIYKSDFSSEQSYQNDADHFRGKILVYAPIFPKYKYGDYLEIKGEINQAPVFKDFNYKQYLAEKEIYLIMTRPQSIKLKKTNTGNWLFAKILSFKSNLRNSLEQNFPFSQAFLLKAMLLGDKSQLPDEIKFKLNKAGIRHLTAISGMHISILVNFLMLIFVGLGLWRKQAFWLTFFFIFLFVLMTGCQASTIRAGLMGFLLLLGQNLGRSNDASRTIIFGASLMLAFNPLFLTEVGFQLSFLAVLGINYLFPMFLQWLKKIPNTFQIKNILAMSLSAQIFTLPILIYNFGYISLVAPITNILVLPFLPFILALGFSSALIGIFSHLGAMIFIFPCWALLAYLLKIVNIFSSFSLSSITLKITWFGILVYYLLLVYLIWQWRQEHRFKILGF